MKRNTLIGKVLNRAVYVNYIALAIDPFMRSMKGSIARAIELIYSALFNTLLIQIFKYVILYIKYSLLDIPYWLLPIWISDLCALNIGSICLEYRISMPGISDIYQISALNIGYLCLEHRDIYALNIGYLCLEHRISMLRISDIYAPSIEFQCLEHT